MLAVVDTGTNFMGLPRRLYGALVSALTRGHDCSEKAVGTHTYTVCQCTWGGAGSFPSLKLELDRQGRRPTTTPDTNDSSLTLTLTLGGRDYVHEHHDMFSTMCVLLLQPVDEGKFATEVDVALLGAPVLRAYTSVFDAQDADAPRIAFVPNPPVARISGWTASAVRRGCALILLSIFAAWTAVVLVQQVLLLAAQGDAKVEDDGEGSEEAVAEPCVCTSGTGMIGASGNGVGGAEVAPLPSPPLPPQYLV